MADGKWAAQSNGGFQSHTPNRVSANEQEVACFCTEWAQKTRGNYGVLRAKRGILPGFSWNCARRYGIIIVGCGEGPKGVGGTKSHQLDLRGHNPDRSVQAERRVK